MRRLMPCPCLPGTPPGYRRPVLVIAQVPRRKGWAAGDRLSARAEFKSVSLTHFQTWRQPPGTRIPVAVAHRTARPDRCRKAGRTRARTDFDVAARRSWPGLPLRCVAACSPARVHPSERARRARSPQPSSGSPATKPATSRVRHSVSTAAATPDRLHPARRRACFLERDVWSAAT